MSNKASFDVAVAFTFDQEGDFSDDVDDSGGPTKYGITISDYSDYLGRQATTAEVKEMTKVTAYKIYKSVYWLQAYENLPQAIATAIFDWTVLHGITSARKMAQVSANKLGAHLTVDGVFGPMTIAALSRLSPKAFVDQYANDIRLWMNNYVKVDKTQKKFLVGWLARADRIDSLA